MKERAARSESDWLPDFCRVPRLLAAVAVAQLVVLVLAFAPDGSAVWTLQRFVAASVFGHWLALSSAVLLCVARVPLGRLPRPLGALLAGLVPVVMAAVGAALVHELDISMGTGLSLPADQRLRFVLGCAGIAALIGAVALRYFYVQEQWAAQVQAQARAEVAALQARIRPHFLFNSMNTIAALVRQDPDTAERAVEDLSDLFRAALGAGDGESSLGEELRLAERYLAIEALRLGPRLQVQWRLEDPLPRDCPLPRLVLQPLVENAVLHGVARLAQGGTIEIAARAAQGRLTLRVRNPCPQPSSDAGDGNHHAQSSIALRLAHRFGAAARMTAAYADGYYACELTVPLP